MGIRKEWTHDAAGQTASVVQQFEGLDAERRVASRTLRGSVLPHVVSRHEADHPPIRAGLATEALYADFSRSGSKGRSSEVVWAAVPAIRGD